MFEVCWTKIDENTSKLFKNLPNAGTNGESILLEEVKYSVKKIPGIFNLYNLNKRFHKALQHQL
ncbi:MAG: hypothetical protein B6U94_04515 [Thermofilum sp. ex4484_79]|nr:MAG: hypothetical protein B6U94_04515 [Thermofilum sp. ex4484_79]